MEIDRSPVAALNRAIAVANVHGLKAGIAVLDAISGREKLGSYHLLYAVRGDFEAQLGHYAAAAELFARARQLADTKSEQTFLEKRLSVGRAIR